MISTRSLFREAVTASWIDLYLHCRSSLTLKLRSFLAFFFFSLVAGWDSRSLIPFFLARLMSLFSALMDLFLESCFLVPCLRSFLLGTCWQTTRVLPDCFLLRALKSLRTAGTWPPAAGFTAVSGAGSGQ